MCIPKFCIKSAGSVISSLRSGKFLASVDIKDAYLHIPYFPHTHSFLRFAARDQHFQFCYPAIWALLCTKSLSEKVLPQISGIHVMWFLDNQPLKDSSAKVCQHSKEDSVPSRFQMTDQKNNAFTDLFCLYSQYKMFPSPGKAWFSKVQLSDSRVNQACLDDSLLHECSGPPSRWFPLLSSTKDLFSSTFSQCGTSRAFPSLTHY